MTKWFIAVVCLLVGVCSAQTAQPILQPEQHFVDSSGAPCSGCALYSYAAGTTNPQPTYKDASETAQNTNPVILDASGSAAIWIGSSAYKFVLLDSSGTTLWTVDNVLAPFPGSQGPFLPLSGGTLTGALAAPYFQFSAHPNICGVGQYVSGWSASGWTCSAPSSTPTGAAGGDLAGTYPNPSVAKVNGGAFPTSASLLGTNSSGQPIAQTGTIANDTTGNASTASALAATPSQCSAGQYATGIAANGNANCGSNSDKYVVAATTCTPTTSTDASCTGTIAFGSSFADTNYGVWTQLTESSGAFLFMTVTSKTTSGISYAITCTFNCSAISQPTVDIYAHHP